MSTATMLTIVGNLTDAPDLRFTPNGIAVANFTVASTPRTLDRQTNEWKDGDALFLRCTVWREYAENVAESLAKGSRVIVSGKLRQENWSGRDGVKRVSYELDVDEVGPVLRWATAKITRTAGAGQPSARSAAAPSTDPWANGPWSDAAGGAPQREPAFAGAGSDEPPF